MSLTCLGIVLTFLLTAEGGLCFIILKKLNLSYGIAPQSCLGLFVVNYMKGIVCRSLFDTWYLWFMVLVKGWKNPIWLMMWAISGILQQVLRSSTLLLISVAPKGSFLSHARYSISYYLCVPSLLSSIMFYLCFEVVCKVSPLHKT